MAPQTAVFLVLLSPSSACDAQRANSGHWNWQLDRLEAIAEQNRTNGQRVLDSTSSEGRCFQDAQRRTAEAVGTINEVTVLAVSCAQRVRGDVAIRRCVADRRKAAS
jgi:hypothetical protein